MLQTHHLLKTSKHVVCDLKTWKEQIKYIPEPSQNHISEVPVQHTDQRESTFFFLDKLEFKTNGLGL